MDKIPCSERIKQILEIRGLKATDLCQMTNINKSTMSQYMSGIYEPKQDRVWLIAKALNVNEAWLMGYDVPMERVDEKKSTPNVRVFDEHDNPIVLDDETLELIDSLRQKPEMKMLFSVSKKATKEDIIRTVNIIEALKKESEKE